MDRKKTILIAVIVNAGLLVVLFVAALSSQDEIGSQEIATTEVTAVNEPLFSGHVDPGLQSQVVQVPSIQKIPLAVPEETKAPPITHRLPPPEQEKNPKPTPVSRDIPKSSVVEVTVKKGDSLAKIAKANNTTVEQITKTNNLSGSFLKIGQVLKLPDHKSVANKPTPAPVLDEKGTTSPEYYTVKVGDNPWGIAVKHHMKMEDLLRLNHLNEEKARKLKPGDHLRIR